jgi:hypothetical protein
MEIIKREGTPMSIHLHHSNRTTSALLRIVSRRRIPVPVKMDHRFMADIGLNQSDMIALHTR